MKPRISIVLGDPCGIGPELVAKLLSRDDVVEAADILVVSDPRIVADGQRIAGVEMPIKTVEEISDGIFSSGAPVLLDGPPLDRDAISLGQASETAGRWQLDCLAQALRLAQEGVVDGICFAPLNKEAMHMAGLRHEDEMGFFAEELGHVGPLGLLNTIGDLWTARVTSHVAIRDISGLVKRQTVLDAISLVDGTLRRAGIDRPRLAVAGLNPHAGDGGMFGDEEIKEIGPAVDVARNEGIAVEGPFSPDTIFLKGRDGEYDAIVTMYHDQGQIAMKLMGFDHGVTVHAGLPFPITTSAHGSAYDIAGRGKANVDALHAAFTVACSIAANQQVGSA